MPDQILHIIGAVAPTIGVIATGGFGYLAARSNNLNKAQFGELKQGMEDIKDDVSNLKKVADDNQVSLVAVQEEIDTLKNSGRSSRRYTLYKDLDTAIARGWTTLEERREIAKLFDSYKILGGNGEIETMYQIYIQLPIKEG
ncbi:TPA: hypothetical protein U2D46_002338 [Streptococcus suis]|uniref:Uncharacterized protein n=1 Tax=Streptococcus suis TaxID=1307 RepID=A0A0M9FHL7_STRSU|nr:hypothetical protein [Streptococcus suis]AZR96816.1 hypothetical protein A7J10_02735 [Streptococcus suis]KPA67427.1 hypothetical protein XK27_05090 [Streptococcus suis]MCK3889241.1 hypothetical protein [Streptococcus suis]MCK3958296.1 hypothetical protein [Streptococcus suis]MCQ8786245.1 hypothetical protein [Streptococcus suis]